MQTSVLIYIAVFLFSFSAEALPNLKFTYFTSEGSDQIVCTHQQIQDLPDWRVKCKVDGENSKKQLEFTAHVVVRLYQRQVEPQSTIEVLYWVTAPGEKPTSPPKFHSTSAIIRLKTKTDVYSLLFDQGVQNDQAYLRLELTP